MGNKEKIIQAIDAYANDIVRCGEYVLAHPELGYKEFKTSAFVCAEFDKLEIPYETGLAITGVKGSIGAKSASPHVCIIGEMDAVRCYGHPNADPQTGAAHACGHNAQIAAMLGAAYGLVKSGVMDTIDGCVSFFAVPAEEFVELEYRTRLKQEGKIACFGGKQELLRLGAFDDIDMAMMIHSQAGVDTPEVFLEGSSLGFMAKQIQFYGRAAHGSEPFDGVNALNAAMLALMGIHANRETFRDEDSIRIHPIVTNGGELVNVVPSQATIETYVRGARMEAIAEACQKVDAAVRGGAMAVGASCEITDIPGYMPLIQNQDLSRVFAENAARLLGAERLHYGMNMTGSTDMGDLSAKIPCIQPTMGGFGGVAHGKDFCVVDRQAAYISPAKLLACTAYDLLSRKKA